MATDPRVLQILLGRLQGPQVAPRGGGGSFFNDIAGALIQAPRIVEQQKIASEELARSRQGAEQDRAIKMAEALSRIRGNERDVAVEDFDRRKESFLEGFGDVEGKLARAEQARKEDPSTLGAQDVASRIAAREKPPGLGSRPSNRIVYDEFGHMFFADPSNPTNPAIPISLPSGGQARRSGLAVGEIKELTSFNSALEGAESVRQTFQEFQQTPGAGPEKIARYNRFLAQASAAAATIGRAVGEDRLTDQDRQVYRAALTPGTFGIVMQELGITPDLVLESIDRMERLILGIQAGKETDYSRLRGLDVSGTLGDRSAGQRLESLGGGDLEEEAIRQYEELIRGGR